MSINIHLQFASGISNDPIVSRMARMFDIDFSITKANITARREGYMILALQGEATQCQQAIDYLRERGVVVSPVAQRIWHNEDVCMQCGMCTTLCPTKALSMTAERTLRFDKELCTTCTLCTKVCPVNALIVQNGTEE